MDIVYNLKKFFNEQQDEAAIPGLGVFFKSTADIDGKPLPKGKSIILFIEKTPRSNAFVNFLGYEENLTEHEAVEVIEQWVSTISSNLKSRKIADIPELGCFEIKKDKVVFTPTAEQNYPTPTNEYGLEELPKTPKTRKIETFETFENDKPSEPKPASKSCFPKMDFRNPIVLWSVIGAVIVILALGGIITYKTSPNFQFWVDVQTDKIQEGFKDGYNNVRKTKQTAEPIMITPVVEEIDEILDVDEPTEEIIQPPKKDSEIQSKSEIVTSTKPAQQTARATQTTTSQKSFNVIGGAFGVKANADNFLAEMKREGYSAEIIFDREKQLHLVSLGAFDTQAKALEFKEQIRRTKGIGCWIFKR